MNLFRTLLVFGLLLAMLWIFGLMVAYKRSAGDDSQVMPSLQAADVKIDSITVKAAGKNAGPDLVLLRDNDNWYAQQGEQRLKLERFRVDQLVSAIKRARLDENLRPRDDLDTYSLMNPRLTFVLKGKLHDREHEWTFKVGKETPDGANVFVTSSDRPDKAYPVDKKSLDDLFVKLATLRPRRLFEFDDAAVTALDLKRGDREVELKRGDDGIWNFEKPALGFAGFDSPSPAKDVKDDAKADDRPTGVKGLLSAIHNLRVDDEDDLIPPGDPLATYGLQAGKESMRFEVQIAGGGPGKKEGREVLLVGKQVPRESAYYARMLEDDGVVKLSAKQLKSLMAALDDPGKIRSKDIAVFEPRSVDRVVLEQGKQEITLSRPAADQEWKMQIGNETARKANEKAIQGLLDAVQGKNAIQSFEDIPAADAKKFDAANGLDSPAAVVSVFTGAVDKKDKAAPPKKDAKPAVTLAFGKAEKDTVVVRRTLPDGTVTRFLAAKSLLDRVVPEQGMTLAFLDTAIPGPVTDEVGEVDIKRGADRLELVRKLEEKAGSRWYLKDAQEPTGQRPADPAKVNQLVDMLSNLQAKKWIAKIDPKADLDPYGLKTPALIITLGVKKDRTPAATVANLLAAGPINILAALAAVLPQPGDITTIQFGKEEKGGIYAQVSGSDAVFLADPDLARQIRETDFRDRAIVLNLQPMLSVGQVAALAGSGTSPFVLASPLGSGQVLTLDPAKVKELRVTVRTREELRNLNFRRADKTWQDQSGLQEFQLDPERVTELVDRLARLRTDRLVALTGSPHAEQKLTPKDATLRFDLTLDDGRTVDITIGAAFERHGFYATTTAWPGAIFLMPASFVGPITTSPVGYFAKERVAAGQ